MSRGPLQRRRARARNGVAPYIPEAFCRDAGSARSDSPKPRQRVRRRLAGAPAAACRSRA
nr:hypothetical protein [Escherichia coli]